MKQAVEHFVADKDAESLRKVAHPIRRYAERYVAQNDGGSLGTSCDVHCSAEELYGCKNKMSKHFFF